MKQTFIKMVALAGMLAVGMNSHATSWRVNSNTTRGAHFADINAAMSSTDVQDGDTLYLDPGCNLSSTQNVTKRVTIIGNGFFHDLAQPYGFATISSYIYLKAAGCKIEGVIINQNLYIAADNVTVERCNIYTSGNTGISYSGSNCKYATIRNCRIASYNDEISGAGCDDVRTTGWTIENNIILGYWYNSDICRLNAATIRNNYIYMDHSEKCFYDLKNCTITNNIIVNVNNKNNIMGGTFTDNTYLHNVISAAENTNYPNNKYLDSNDQAAIFTLSGSNDQQYQLCEGSPAKGYATDGGDCGPYGSGYTYVPGGLPLGMPYYTEATIGSMAHDGKVNVTLKIAVQDE